VNRNGTYQDDVVRYIPKTRFILDENIPSITVQSDPMIYLINPNGEIVKNDLTIAELEDVLKNLLKN